MRIILISIFAALSAFGSAAELIVSNYGSNTVSRYALSDASFLGNFTGGTLSGPLATRVGPDGNLYVASETTNTIVRYSLTTHVYLDTFVTNGLNGPNGFDFDSAGNLLVGNFNDSSVAKVDSKGVPLGKLVPDGSGGLHGADIGTTVRDGILYVPSFYTNSILKYDAATGASLGAFVTAGSGGLTHPRGIAFHGDSVYVTSENGNSVLRYGLDGSFRSTFVPSGSGQLSGAAGIAFGGDGYLYLSSWRNNRILRYDENSGDFAGAFITTGLNGPTTLTVVPEPATMTALGGGLAVLLRRRKP